MRNRNIALMWPPQRMLVESLFRHYNGLAETAGYLENVSRLLIENEITLSVHDCAVRTYTAGDIANIVYKNDIIFICINMNNIIDSINCAKYLKSIDLNTKIVAYGEGVCCRPEYFASLNLFDYIIANGQYELGIEVILLQEYDIDDSQLHPVLHGKDAYNIQNTIIFLSKEAILPVKDWGVPLLEKIPLDDYIRVSNGELHITACKGCPFDCEFCNERHVSTKCLRYRNIDQLIKYLDANKKVFKSAYLDSSTFTFNKKWVKDFCVELSKCEDVLPWKTCTRLDCLDEEVIYFMSEANCKRISVGIESMSKNIQNRNNKIINSKELKKFRDICISYSIVPRLLLIIGLKDQTYDEIIMTRNMFLNSGFDVRFRIYQDFDFLITEQLDNITVEKLKNIDRISIPNIIEKKHINYYRQLEYPRIRKL